MHRLYTIGFTRASAERFFETLRQSGVSRIVDIRLHNANQLAGFAKRGDLAYFARMLLSIQVVEAPELAPSDEALRAYRANHLTWAQYADAYDRLIAERATRQDVFRSIVDCACLLCSEAAPNHCHRRLAAERYAREQPVEVIHL